MATATVKKEETKKPIQFYFVKSAKKTFALLTENIRIQADNHVYVADPEDPKYDRIVEFLRGHRGNKDNGGIQFYEVAKEQANKEQKAVVLDDLMDMEHEQILKLVKGGIEKQRLTKGELICEYLKQQGVK